MSEKRNRFVLLCQQTLAVAATVAVAAPAASVVTLDIVAPQHPPGVPGGDQVAASGALVASAPVEPEVREIPVGDAGGGTAQATAQAVARGALAGEDSGTEVAAITDPEPVSGFTTVGVTWKHGVEVDEDDIVVSVRSLEDGAWSGWEELEYHDDHGPDPDSAEALRARPGTDPILVGNVDQVQVKVETADGEVPADTEVALIDPGATTDPQVEEPAIDTADLPAAPAPSAAAPAAVLSAATTTGASGAQTADPASTDGVLAADRAWVTPKPKIFSRAQWGADERMRDKSSLSYYEVHAGFVHHTVNANGYTRDQVPALLRGIYAYHTQSKGWSDIGYNFVVDRFGRIWEGRYGGVARPVVGAHTLGYNEYSFAMSALGNFDSAKPSAAMLDAYGRLFAWKLSLHGVSTAATKQQVGDRTFPAINGHRDAGTTACPGRYLYNRLTRIRELAEQYQRPFTARTRSADVAGSPWPDLVVRDRATKTAVVVRTGGQMNFQNGTVAATGLGGADLVTAARDLTEDGFPDLVARDAASGVTSVYPGTAEGTYGSPVLRTDRFSGLDQLTGGVDLTGDGRFDLVGRVAETKTLVVYPGNGQGGFGSRRVLADTWGYGVTAGVGDLDKDGDHDLVARAGKTLYFVPVAGGSLGTRVALPGTWGQFDVITGAGDLTNDRKADVVARNRTTGMTYIYPGDGAGGLLPRFGPFARFKSATFLAAGGNLSGNHRNDLVTRTARGAMVVHANNGLRNIDGVTRTGISLAGSNLLLNVGDWNGDGFGDVMSRLASNGSMQLRLGDGKGGFATPVQAGTGWGAVTLVAAVGDLTGDGNPDLMGQPRGGAMRIYPGNGGTGFRSSYVAHSEIASTGQTGVGLWNGDGSPDSLFRRSDGTLHLYPGNGPGGLLDPTRVGGGVARYDWLQAVGDADGRGRTDLLARERDTGMLWLVPGDRNGFGPRRYVGRGFEAYDLSG